jgi:hypothetical protein
MELIDFLALIQLAAGLNIAFVAVEVSRGYTRILSDRIFNVEGMLNEAFKDILRDIQGNAETLKNFHPIDVGKKNTLYKIEEGKRNCEVLGAKVESVKDEITKIVTEKCNLRCFSGLCLVLFLFCCILLFLAPFDDAIAYVLPLTILTSIYLAAVYMKEDYGLFCNLKMVVIIYVAVIVFSFIVYIPIYMYCIISESLQSTVVIIASILPFLNFILFYAKISSIIKEIKNLINKRHDELCNELNEINASVRDLQSVERIAVNM